MDLKSKIVIAAGSICKIPGVFENVRVTYYGRSYILRRIEDYTSLVKPYSMFISYYAATFA